MSDKLMAGLVTAVVIAPVCVACALGPAVLASFFGGMFGWMAGLDPIPVIGLTIIAGIAVHSLVRRKRTRSSNNQPVTSGSGAVRDRNAIEDHM